MIDPSRESRKHLDNFNIRIWEMLTKWKELHLGNSLIILIICRDNNSISSYIENIYPCSEYCEVKEVADDRINTVVIESPTKSSESPLKNRLKN